MKFGRYQITLARQKSPDTSGQEQGSSGSNSAGYFEMEQYLGKVRNPSIRQIMEMIDNDGTAAALFNVMSFPVQATNWHIEPHPLDILETTDAKGNKIVTHPQSDFVESALRKPQHEGGMSTPFSLVMADILLGIAQGHRFFEIVYKLDEQGRVVFQKVVSREPGEFTILKDDTGGFAGVSQKVKRGGKTIDVTIDLQYCFLYTYRKERNKLKGLTAFRAGWYHYDKKHKLYYLANQQGQVAAIPLKTLEAPSGASQPERDANLAAVDKMAVRPSIALPFGWKLNIQQMGRSIDLLPYLDHHDAQMARAVLAQMILLGNQTGAAGGSYALSESHTDLFMLGELGLMSSIEEHITAFLISKLYDYNFANPLYGTFKFDSITDSVATLMNAAFTSLIAKGGLPQWVTDGIAKKVAEQMEIEEPDDAGDGSGDGSGSGAGGANADAVEAAHKKKEARLAKGDWWRELTAAESKVQFSSMKKKADDAETNMVDALKPVFQKVSADATKRLKPLLEDQGAKALDGFELKFSDDFRKTMVDQMMTMYSTAKTSCADEIKQKAPANKTKSKDLITQHAQAIVEKQFSDLTFNLKTIVTDAVRKNLLDKTELSIGQILALISAMFDDFFDAKEPLTASSLITTAINIGRDDVFQEYGSKIYGYQYSAILDEKVCPICGPRTDGGLDGSVIDEATYFSTIWMPPIHFNCRCIWVAIMSDELDPPEFTGLPDAPGGVTEPLLADHHVNALYLGQEAKWRRRQI